VEAVVVGLEIVVAAMCIAEARAARLQYCSWHYWWPGEPFGCFG